MKLVFLSVCCFCFTVLPVLAENSISGKIQADRETLLNLSIHLYKKGPATQGIWEWEKVAETSPGRNGEFRFADLPAGEYRLRPVGLKKSDRFIEGLPKTIRIPSDEGVDELNLKVGTGGVIELNAVGIPPGERLEDIFQTYFIYGFKPDDPPMASETFYFDNRSYHEFRKSKISLFGVPPGEWKIRILLPGTGAKDFDISIKMRKKSRIILSARDQSNQGVSGRISCLSDLFLKGRIRAVPFLHDESIKGGIAFQSNLESSAFSYPDENGNFQILALPPGDYMVSSGI